MRQPLETPLAIRCNKIALDNNVEEARQIGNTFAIRTWLVSSG